MSGQVYYSAQLELAVGKRQLANILYFASCFLLTANFFNSLKI